MLFTSVPSGQFKIVVWGIGSFRAMNYMYSFRESLFFGGLLCRSIAQFLREDAILKIPVMPIYGAIPRNMSYTVHLYYANGYTYSLFIHIYQIPIFFYYLHHTILTHIS